MFFSKAILGARGLSQDKNWELGDNLYRAHQLAWRLFSDGTERERDFIFRWELAARQYPTLYVVSSRKPDDRDGLFRAVDTKPYQPTVAEGEEFVFQLRVNPVVKRRDEDGRQVVADVVMDAKSKSDRSSSQAELVHTSCLAWLTDGSDRPSRAANAGFYVDSDSFEASNYVPHRFRKSRGASRVTISTCDLSGVLKVEDPDRFVVALTQGIGASKAFGCGLLMIKRAR